MWVAVCARAVAARRSASTSPCTSSPARSSPDSTTPVCTIMSPGPNCASVTRTAPAGPADEPLIPDLPARLSVERRAVQDEADLLAFGGELGRAVRAQQGNQAPIGLRRPVAGELGLPRLGRHGGQVLVGPPLPRRALGPLALLGHQRLEALLVDRQAGLGGELGRELLREAEGVVELEHHVAGEALPFLGPFHLGVEQRHPLPERPGEPLLLRGGDLLDVRAVLHQLGVAVAELLDRALDDRGRHVLLDPEPPRVRDDPAQHPAQDVAASLVGRLHAVGDQERRRATVLGDHLERDVGAVVRTVRDARERLGDLEERAQQVRLEDVIGILEYGRDALQARARVDVLRGELRDHVDVGVHLVLDEHQIPDLHEPLLVDVRSAVRPEPGASVHEDLRARSARPGGMGRPVVRELPVLVDLAPPHDPRLRHADGVPRGHGLLVLLVHRRPQAPGIDPPDLGDELVSPGHRLCLEVVAEGEVAEHLEERQVAIGVSDVVDVQRPEDLLRGHRAWERRLRVAEEVRDELVHPGVREQQPGLRRRDQRRRGHDAMVALLEEAQERRTDLSAFHREGESTRRLPSDPFGPPSIPRLGLAAAVPLPAPASPACPLRWIRRRASRDPACRLGPRARASPEPPSVAGGGGSEPT